MKMLTNRRTLQLLVLAALAVVAVALWSSHASAQPAKPPFLLYGAGEPGDIISVYDNMGEELGMTEVASDNTWHMNVNCASEKLPTLTFQINGAPAIPEINQTGSDQAEIILNLAPIVDMPDADSEMMEDDMTEDGEMMDEGDSSMMQEDDDEMMDDEMSDDEMMDNGYPESGTGGLADQGPSTAALIGTVAILLTLLSALTIHRLRSNRA